MQHRRVREVRVAQRTWIVRRSAPASRRCVAYECLSVGTDATIDAGRFAAKRTASQMHREVSGLSARQPCSCPGNVFGRIHRYSSRSREQRRAQGHLAPVAALPALDADHHALAVDVRDFQLQQLAARRPAP